MYANKIGYTDIDPFQVVKFINDRNAVIREMKCEKNPSFVPEFVAGGFFGTVINQHEQKWIITDIHDGREFKIRLHRNGQWRDKDGNRYKLSETPVKFYDYNF